MSNMSLSFLQNIGLSSTEGALYELLLKLGEIPISTLIRESKIKRPTVYKALATLEKKELVLSRDIRKIIHVRPESPAKLAEFADKEYQKIEQANKTLNAILPGMSLSYANSTERPVVRVYEGVEGLKEVYEDMLVEKKPLYALLQAAEVEPELYSWLTTRFVKKRVKEKIHVKAIVATSRASREYIEKNTEEFRTTRMVDSKQFPFQHEIDIYGDKVAIIHYKKGEPLIGILIHHPAVSVSMKAWFELAWMGAGKD